jgi:heme o synthase
MPSKQKNAFAMCKNIGKLADRKTHLNTSNLLADRVYTKGTFNITAKISDYLQLLKVRLASLVVLSAVICFAFGSGQIDWTKMVWLIIGGFLITGSSNGLNQIIEKETDKLMTRTQNRPLPQERITRLEAFIVCAFLGILGIYILWTYLNPLSGILGVIALFLYVAVYTPLKKITPFAVFVGAFPGAIPPLLGYVAATNSLDIYAWILFGIQFIWQFPHFWAIAWVIDEDYQKAGFKMLPSSEGRSKSSAFQIFMYSFFLLPIGMFPVIFKMSGWTSAAIILLSGFYFTLIAYRLYKSCEIKTASRLMFASFIYLPIVQILILIDKL